ncbi:MAG: protease inhibitor I42 family protein, partial [Acidimicrobiales bacterium]
SPHDVARLAGMTAAQEEHQRLGTSMHERVPVFEVIEDARIWLFFQPMRTLFGAYERHGDAAGIIVNSQHPLTLQRFTAAHEYGHHALGHEASADDEERIYRSGGQTVQEVSAQAFAGEFLMPIQLVNYALRTMALTGQHPTLTPIQIYQLALELGVSYSAVLTQLVGQHKLSVDAGRRLRALSPLAIKTDMGGVTPANSWADVWLLDESQEGRHVVARLRDEVHVRLRETPSTGYVWDLVEQAAGVAELVTDEFQSLGDEVEIGADGVRDILFRVVAPGSRRIRLELRRPWQSDGQAAGIFEATVDAVAAMTGDVDEGATTEQKQGIVDDFRTVAA